MGEQDDALRYVIAAIGTMAAGVAHEINNPLATLVANLDLATRCTGALAGPPDVVERLAAELRDAHAAAVRLRDVAKDLELFARSETDRRSVVDVRAILETTLRLAGPVIRTRVTLVEELGAAPRVEASAARLGQVFLDLLTTAATACGEGDRAREMRVRLSGEGGRAVVTIDGPCLLEPATGMPFAICHHLVGIYGGRLEVHAERGQRFAVRVELPPARTVPAAPAAARPTAAARRGRVMVVDDEPLITRTVRRILGIEHDVTVFEDANAALALIEAGERFDVILCDLMMPQLSGMDLHKAIFALSEEQADRMVFMTGGAFTPKAKVFLATAPNPRVDKPFDAASLRAIVNALIKA